VVAFVADVDVAGSEGTAVVVDGAIGGCSHVDEVDEVDVVVVDVFVEPEKIC
jgi:hypothetical protein